MRSIHLNRCVQPGVCCTVLCRKSIKRIDFRLQLNMKYRYSTNTLHRMHIEKHNVYMNILNFVFAVILAFFVHCMTLCGNAQRENIRGTSYGLQNCCHIAVSSHFFSLSLFSSYLHLKNMQKKPKDHHSIHHGIRPQNV